MQQTTVYKKNCNIFFGSDARCQPSENWAKVGRCLHRSIAIQNPEGIEENFFTFPPILQN
jgi:hypothetical protein